ncbi:MAG: hypothetical protein ACSLFQ_07770 [Thermoanaerobaculia bacterium]
MNATVTGMSEPKSVRVYFRAESEGPEYYLEMMALEGDNFMAVLPATLRETELVEYRIVAVAGDDSMTATEPVEVPVRADCTQPRLNEEEQSFADNIILGLTDLSQTGSPTGFSCSGVVKVVGVDQTMAPNSACDEVRLANADPCIVAVPPGGLAPMTFAQKAAIAGGIIAGAIIIENNNDEPREPVSPARP